MDPNEVATQFVQHYYTIFDSGKANYGKLAPLYRPQSMLTWESNNVQGPEAIVKCLSEMRFEQVKHVVTSVSAQPSGVPNALLVSVNGQLQIDDGQALQFNQVWHLLQEGTSFWIHNDIFRLNWGA